MKKLPMKKIPVLIIAFLGISALPACGQSNHPAQITFKIIDDIGQPVTEGTVRSSAFARWMPGEGFGSDVNKTYTAEIDSNGLAVLAGESLRGRFSYGVYPVGRYYPGFGGEYRFDGIKSGRWEPWNAQVTVIVPRMINPTALYARKVGVLPRLKILNADKIGFDLIESDWVKPYGKGNQADLFFEYRTIIPMQDEAKAYEFSLAVTFANEGDGIVSYPAQPKKRLLDLPRQAPVDGYGPRWIKALAGSRRVKN